jgi:glycosylphosphatidylinositol transamidase
LRNNPQLLFVRLPNILSFLCIVVGVVWLLLLPLNDYSRQTYISENALLPGQVHAYFTGSEQNIFRGYKKEIQALIQEGREDGPQNPEVESTPAYVKRLEERRERNRVLIIRIESPTRSIRSCKLLG